METVQTLNGALYADMIRGGAANLRAHAKEINDLNVFPIPDGDTGDNMLLTAMGGICTDVDSGETLGEVAERVAGGMLLSARGNSGVILSQFFDGLKTGFSELWEADAHALGEAFRQGVASAYKAVMTPTEGTILTVAREATEYACGQNAETPEVFLDAFLREARASLERTPDLLPVLKKAGVVDSGAAGLICMADGMRRAITGEDMGDVGGVTGLTESTHALDLDAFTEDSVLEFGYCTELLLRLQTAKTDPGAFDVQVLTDYLQTVGDSVVTVRRGSMVKLHVHTMTPEKVLGFCRQYGEFLKVKIENMSLQHNHTVMEQAKKTPKPTRARKAYGVVAVASGEGLKQTFTDCGADVIVDGGQSMNPSAEDFMAAFDEVNADTVLVFPNNGNIILTAKQAAGLYTGADVRVIESTTIGAGYASLAMLDTGSGDTDAIVAALTEAMQGVVTVEISRCVRDATMDGAEMHRGDYIGFVGKQLLAVNQNRMEVLCGCIDSLNPDQYDICILIGGKDADAAEAERFEGYMHKHYGGKEVYIINGGQDVYDYILIAE